MGSFMWAQEKTSIAIEHFHKEGLFDINVLNLTHWMQETSPTKEELLNALDTSIQGNHTKCIEFLLNKCVFSTEELEKAVLTAIQHNRAECLNLLLSREEMPGLSPYVKKTAISHILQHDQMECLEILLDKNKQVISKKSINPPSCSTFSITDAIIESIKNDANCLPAWEGSNEWILQELAEHPAHRCISLLENKGYFAIDLSSHLHQFLENAILQNNTSYLKAILSSPSGLRLGEVELKEILTKAVEMDSRSSLEVLLSSRSISTDKLGEMLTLSAKAGSHKCSDLLLSYAYKIPEKHLKQALLLSASWASYSTTQKLLASSYLPKDEQLMINLLSTLLREGCSSSLKAFLSSQHAQLIPANELCSLVKESILSGNTYTARTLFTSSIFTSKVSDKQKTDLIASLPEGALESLPLTSSTPTLSFPDPNYAIESFLHLSTYGSSDSLKELLKLDSYDNLSAENLSKAIDNALKANNKENVFILLESPQFKKLSKESLFEIGRGDLFALTQLKHRSPKTETIPLNQKVLNFVFPVLSWIGIQMRDPKLTPASDH
jgi:hypothetical protein